MNSFNVPFNSSIPILVSFFLAGASSTSCNPLRINSYCLLITPITPISQTKKPQKQASRLPILSSGQKEEPSCPQPSGPVHPVNNWSITWSPLSKNPNSFRVHKLLDSDVRAYALEGQNQLRQTLWIKVTFQAVNDLMLLIFQFNCVSPRCITYLISKY
jgi:hypothetical protein